MDSGKVKFERLAPEHAKIAPYLRREDKDEIKALSGLSPEIGVAYSIASSQKGYAAYYDGTLTAIFGISNGLIWLVGTDAITKHPITFFRTSRKIFHELTKGHNYLHNYVDARNKLHLRWLEWIGFTIEEAQILGVENRLFHKVSYNIERGDNNGRQAQHSTGSGIKHFAEHN